MLDGNKVARILNDAACIPCRFEPADDPTSYDSEIKIIGLPVAIQLGDGYAIMTTHEGTGDDFSVTHGASIETYDEFAVVETLAKCVFEIIDQDVEGWTKRVLAECGHSTEKNPRAVDPHDLAKLPAPTRTVYARARLRAIAAGQMVEKPDGTRWIVESPERAQALAEKHGSKVVRS